MEVVKVQLPLVSTEDRPSALVYNIGRTVEAQIDVTPELIKLMAGDVKAFFSAEVGRDGIELIERVEDEAW